MSKPVLRAPDMSKPWIIMADSSKIAASAILMQRENERADSACYVVSYASRKLLPREQNYATIEQELLSILFALSKFNHYIYGHQISVYSDHRALKWLNSLVKHSPRLARWSLILQNYDITMHYV